MGQKGFYFDQTRCTGCRTCSVACSDLHNYAPDIVLRRVIEFEGGTWKVNTNGTCTQNVFAYYTSIGCNECENPVCVKACPTGAHHKRTEDGLVVIDTEKCIGCGMCAKACPYGSPVLDKAACRSASRRALSGRSNSGILRNFGRSTGITPRSRRSRIPRKRSPASRSGPARQQNPLASKAAPRIGSDF